MLFKDKRGNEIVLENIDGDFKELNSKIKNLLFFILKLEEIKNSHLEVFLVSENKIKEINKIYRKKNKSTNVLTFSYFNLEEKKMLRPDLNKKFLGEIFLAPDFIKRKKEDILYILIHGFLHLIGYVHSGKKNSIIMENKEREIISKFISAKNNINV
jgi:probable rRNA maturation factor